MSALAHFGNHRRFADRITLPRTPRRYGSELMDLDIDSSTQPAALKRLLPSLATDLTLSVLQPGQPVTEQGGACLLKRIGVTLGVMTQGDGVDT